MDNIVVIGQQVSGQEATIKHSIEKLINVITGDTFTLAELLYEVKTKGYYNNWGYNTFQGYIASLNIRSAKAYYLVKIVDIMRAVGATRFDYEPLGIVKLREITTLDPNGIYIDPKTKEQKPMKNYILGFLEKGQIMTVEQVKSAVATLKGLVGEDQLVYVPFRVKQSVNENVIQPALELAKRNLGSAGRDETTGEAIDYSNSTALEIICIAYSIDPANQFLGGQVVVEDNE